VISKEQIVKLAEAHLAGGKLYLTGIRIGADNHINIFIDGDEGVTIQDCVSLSRAIEGQLDREKDDFALDVSSHGATSPLVMPRQYKKHLGRELEIKLNAGGKLEGTLVEADNDRIRLEFQVRENKPIGKGKITVTKDQVVTYQEIKESKIKLKY